MAGDEHGHGHEHGDSIDEDVAYKGIVHSSSEGIPEHQTHENELASSSGSSATITEYEVDSQKAKSVS